LLSIIQSIRISAKLNRLLPTSFLPDHNRDRQLSQDGAAFMSPENAVDCFSASRRIAMTVAGCSVRRGEGWVRGYDLLLIVTHPSPLPTPPMLYSSLRGGTTKQSIDLQPNI